MRELQTALAAAEDDEERDKIRRELKRLEEEQRNMVTQMDEVQQRMDTLPQDREMRQAGEQLQEAREDMRNISESLQEEQVSQALAAGRRAQENLEELKDEFKETEGNPESKSRTRNMQREVAQRKMLQDVPQADVIIVNPTHYSVALRYDQEQDGAPVLLAKGVDSMAMKIREIAVSHSIPVFTAPLLARAIYHTTELEKEVSSELYIAVAKVLAYVFQLKTARPGNYPKPPTDLSIPKEFNTY